MPKERPVLFSAAMVRAILDGRKTQTRRLVKPQPVCDSQAWACYHDKPNRLGQYGPCAWRLDENPPESMLLHCPYGAVGDRLWVRETFDIESFGAGVAQIRYRADGARGNNAGVSDRKLPNRLGAVSPIHMPRWASRITLEITSVRVERLQSISEEDAIAEGVATTRQLDSTWYHGKGIGLFRELWERINGADSWERNPWVWVLGFKRVEN